MHTLVRTNIIFFLYIGRDLCHIMSCSSLLPYERKKKTEKGGGQFKLRSSFSMYNTRDTGVSSRKEGRNK